MKTLILCDFDGTVSLRDIGYEFLNRFTSGDWEAIDREFCDGKIGSKEAYLRIAKIFKGNKQAFLDFVRQHSRIDPFFSSFYHHCQASGMDVKIVSDGLDFYIKTLLDMNGLAAIPFYANRTSFVKGKMRLSFPYWDESCGLCGTCKKRLVQIHRKNYDFIVFIGNGLSDRCAAQEADFVFAKDALYPYCIDRDIRCHFYRGFQEILSDIKKRIGGIIFDLDGTLVESYEAIYLGLCEVWKHYRKEIFPLSDLRNHLQADLETTLSVFFSPEEIERGIPIMRRKYKEVYLDRSRLLDGTKEVLEMLRGRGILLSVATNKFGRFSRGLLNHLGVAGCFKAVVGAGDVQRNKPFPEMIHALLKAMDLPPNDVIFVGDTPSDIETGRQAGVDVYAVSSGFHSKKELSEGKPKRILRNLKELASSLHPIPFPET